MKKIIFFFAILFFSALIFAETNDVATTQMPSSEKQSQEDQAIYISDDVKVIPKTVHEENDEKHFTIDLNYPQLDGKNLSENQKKFNQQVTTMATQEADQFKKYVAADTVHMDTLPEELRKNSFRMDYDIDLVKPGPMIISVRLAIEGFQAGRAHPYHHHSVLTFNLETGKVLTLDEIFKPHSNYLNVIAKICKEKLNAKLEDKWMIGDGTRGVPKNYKIWNLEDDDLLITFEEYQVAPYSSGLQEVEIPYVDLKSIISKRSPIYPCVKDPKVCKIKVE